jgi:hypothetical protein
MGRAGICIPALRATTQPTLRNLRMWGPFCCRKYPRRMCMNAIIYLVGLVVIVMAILSFIGLR